MNDIALAVQQLARAIEDQPDEVRIWAAASFAGHLGLDVIVSANPGPVEAIIEVGELWADSVAELLEDQPHRRGETMRGAHGVVQRLLDGAVARRRPKPAPSLTTPVERPGRVASEGAEPT